MDERKKAAAEAKAELSFSQALWYAWGRLDSGAYKELGFNINPFDFAQSVKTQTLAFELEETHSLQSIQDAWSKFIQGYYS